MKWTTRLLLSLAIATLLLVVLMRWGGVSPRDVHATLRAVPVDVFLFAFGLHLFTYSMRAVRFRILLPSACRPGFRRSLVISAAHNMASYLLPAKTGEASLVVYLHVQGGVPTRHAVATWLVARFLDAATLCLGLASACLFLSSDHRYAALEWLATTSGALFAGAVLFLSLSVRGDLVVRALESPLRWLRLHHWSWGEHLVEQLNNLAVALRNEPARRLVPALLVSLPLWCSVFGFYFVLCRAMGMPAWVGYAEATFGAALGMLANLLPLNGAAGVGTQELGWVTGFHQFLGVGRDVALSTGLGVHLVQLFNIVVMGVGAHMGMGVMPRVRPTGES